ncbi:MAG: glutamine amidotransferase, partial [Limisphaerales bacterium]
DSWQPQLEKIFLVRRYLFDSRLESARDYAQLTFEGRESAIGGALKSLSERFQGQPLAGVLLFTDGNATDLEEGFSETPGLPPLYPVMVGKNSDLLDIALENVSASQTIFEDAPVTLTGTIKAKGFDGEKLAAQVILNGKVVAEQNVEPKKGADIPLRFQLKPDQPGLSFYQLRVAHAKDLKNNTNLVEATAFNNDRIVTVDRGRGPHRILYVGGRPNWEYKFLNRAVSEDPEVQLVSLIRIARREPKFTFRGRTGESSNPLFRGFNKTNEETERYDQPVLIRLNTKDESELRSGFPIAAEDLYGYEGIILDDMEAEFFKPDQLMLIQRYVSERGGGFLMLGGADSLENGKYARSPVGDMLPFYLDRLPEARPASGYKYELTREGWLQPWMRLRSTENEERNRLESIPPFLVLNQLREIKPGASVLATVSDPFGNKFPAVAMQRFGNGRTAVVTIGDLFHAGSDNEGAQADLGKSWRQMLRWLISDVSAQCEIRMQPIASVGQESSVSLMVKARDKKFEPLENASIQITITGPAVEGKTNQVTIPAEASEKEAGVYRANYVPREPGAYRATAVITDSSGVRVAEVETGWASEPLAREFASLQPNRALLEEIARKTGGQLLTVDGLEDFVESLQQKKAPIIETYSYPLWHKPFIFIVALGCFIAEWGIRRWKGLA